MDIKDIEWLIALLVSLWPCIKEQFKKPRKKPRRKRKRRKRKR